MKRTSLTVTAVTIAAGLTWQAAPAHAQRPVPDPDTRPCVSQSERLAIIRTDRPWRRYAVEEFTETTLTAMPPMPDVDGVEETVWDWYSAPACTAGMAPAVFGFTQDTKRLAAVVWGGPAL